MTIEIAELCHRLRPMLTTTGACSFLFRANSNHSICLFFNDLVVHEPSHGSHSHRASMQIRRRAEVVQKLKVELRRF